MVDYKGISLLLGALAAFITVVGGFAMQVAIFIRQGKSIQVSKELHDSVNGQTVALKEAIRIAAFKSGEAAGVATERADPQVSAKTIV